MKQIIILSFLFTILSACSNSPTPIIDFNPNTNFQVFTSYQYSDQTDTSIDANPIIINRIKTAIDINLAAKGLTKQSFDLDHSADLTIQVSFSEEVEQPSSSFSIGVGSSRIGSSSGSRIGMNTNVPINNNTATITKITIDIHDKEQSIWHGSDSYSTSKNLNTAEKDLAVNATVDKILANFPPKQESLQK